MAGFLTPLRLEYIDGREWKVITPFEYCLGAPNGPERLYVHPNFITDFASIPRILWAILPPTGAYGKAAVLHDWLYRGHFISSVTAAGFGWRRPTRAEADHILLEAMQVLGVDWLTRYTIYAGVRIGGWMTWRKYHPKY